MGNPKWVKFWPGNLHGDPWYALLPGDARGLYLQLLMLQAWMEHGRLPTSTQVIADLCRIPHNDFIPLWERVREKFEEDKHGHYNRKMDAEVRASRFRSQKGSKAANARWKEERKQGNSGFDDDA